MNGLQVIEAQHLHNELIPLFAKLAQDDQVSILIVRQKSQSHARARSAMSFMWESVEITKLDCTFCLILCTHGIFVTGGFIHFAAISADLML